LDALERQRGLNLASADHELILRLYGAPFHTRDLTLSVYHRHILNEIHCRKSRNSLPDKL